MYHLKFLLMHIKQNLQGSDPEISGLNMEQMFVNKFLIKIGNNWTHKITGRQFRKANYNA